MDSSSKVFKFYYKGSEQLMKVYQGTTQQEIISSIKSLLKIDTECTFCDEDGIPVVISYSLPNQEKIFIQQGDRLTKEIKEQQSQNMVWNRQISKADFIDDLTFTTFAENKATAYMDISITQGQHFWIINISHVHCCHDFGITKGSIGQKFWQSYSLQPDDQNYNTVVGLTDIYSSTGTSGLNLFNMKYGCLLDMNKSKFIIANLNTQEIIQNKKFSFTPVIPFYHSNKHQITIKLSFSETPQWILDQL